MSATRIIGKIKDAHGIKGEIYITLFPKEAAWLNKLKIVSLKQNENSSESKILNVRSARLHKGGLIVKTQELSDRNAAEALKGYLFEIPEDYLVSKKGESIYLSEIAGFEVRDAEKLIGKIVNFSTNGAQDLLVVKTKNGEFDIPFVEAFVKEINYESKFIQMELPEGLFDMENAQEQENDRAQENDEPEE